MMNDNMMEMEISSGPCVTVADDMVKERELEEISMRSEAAVDVVRIFEHLLDPWTINRTTQCAVQSSCVV
jgi:hypothetical protein